MNDTGKYHRMNNKNPYEIRTELLRLVIQICMFNRDIHGETSTAPKKKIDAAEIVEMAEEFNKFISKAKYDSRN